MVFFNNDRAELSGKWGNRPSGFGGLHIDGNAVTQDLASRWSYTFFHRNPDKGVTDGLSFCLLGSRDSTMDQIKTKKHYLTVIFPAQRWLPEFRMTTIFTPMGGNLYRLDDGNLCGRISFGDVFEALPADQKDAVVFQRRVKRAGLKRACYVIPHDMVERTRFVELMKRIEGLGGFAAVDFKGLFLVFLPKTCDLDVNLELHRIGGIPN